eukprot:2253-Prymnesium_polylepis.1
MAHTVPSTEAESRQAQEDNGQRVNIHYIGIVDPRAAHPNKKHTAAAHTDYTSFETRQRTAGSPKTPRESKGRNPGGQ